MNKKFYLIGILILILSFLFDKFLLETVPKMRLDSLNGLMKYFTMAGSGYGVLIFLILFSFYVRRKDIFLKGGLSLGLALVVVGTIRLFITRVRPDIALVIKDSFSFPSGHATAVFSVFPLLKKNFKKFSFYWLIFAILIVISRLYLGVHYLSDVVAGCLVGLVIGGFVVRRKWGSLLKKV